MNARKALAYCIDSSIVQQSIGGEYSAKLDVTCLSDNMYYMDPDKWHTAVSEMEDYTVQDYDKAKEYLAKSKYSDGFEFDFTLYLPMFRKLSLFNLWLVRSVSK